jgi:hypothetical protein
MARRRPWPSNLRQADVKKGRVSDPFSLYGLNGLGRTGAGNDCVMLGHCTSEPTQRPRTKVKSIDLAQGLLRNSLSQPRRLLETVP